MTDVAALGFNVDSSQAVAATANLSRMAGAAAGAAIAQDNQSKSSVRATTATGAYAKQLQQMNDQYIQAAAATDKYKSANDNLSSSFKKMASDTAEAGKNFASSAIGALDLGNHLKLIASAAWLLSPALRSGVNTVLKETGSLMAAMLPSLGIVGRGLATAWSWLAPAASLILRFLGPIGMVISAVLLMGKAFSDAGSQLKKYEEINDQAAAVLVSTDFWQRQVAGAKAMDVSTDRLTETFKKFNEVSQPKLGGGELQNRVKELVKAGNFKGNTGVADLKTAQGVEERWNAIVSLIGQAISKGERLAAIDLAAKFLPPALVDRLREQDDFLTKIKAKADAVKPLDLFSALEIARGLDLQKRLKEAKDTISGISVPLLNLTELGMKFQRAWVSILEAVAKLVEGLDTLLGKLGEVPEWFSTWLSKGGQAAVTTDYSSFSPSETGIPIPKAMVNVPGAPNKQKEDTQAIDAEVVAYYKEWNTVLEVMASNTAAAAVQQRILNDARKDISKNPGTEDEWSKAIKRQGRAIALQEAEAKSIDLSVGAHARLRTELVLREVAEKAHIPITAARLRQMTELGLRAESAAMAIGKLKLASDAAFERATLGLSDEEAGIAAKLRGIYGADWENQMDSAEAGMLRLNYQLKTAKNLSTDFASGFVQDMMRGTTATQAMNNALTRLQSALMDMVIKNLVAKAFGGASGGGLGGLFSGLFGGSQAQGGNYNTNSSTSGIVPSGPGSGFVVGGNHAGGIVGTEPTFMRYVHPAYFDTAPRFHSGGIAGNEVPIIAQRGEGVFTPGQMAAMGGGGNTKVEVNVINNAAGTKVETKEREENGASIHDIIISTVNEHTSNGGMDASMKGRYGIGVRGRSR